MRKLRLTQGKLKNIIMEAMTMKHLDEFLLNNDLSDDTLGSLMITDTEDARVALAKFGFKESSYFGEMQESSAPLFAPLDDPDGWYDGPMLEVQGPVGLLLPAMQELGRLEGMPPGENTFEEIMGVIEIL